MWTAPAIFAAAKRAASGATRRRAASGLAPAPDNGFTIATTSTAGTCGDDVIVSALHAPPGASMSRLSVRLLLLVVCLAAIVGAAFHVWSSDRRLRVEAEAGRR